MESAALEIRGRTLAEDRVDDHLVRKLPRAPQARESSEGPAPAAPAYSVDEAIAHIQEKAIKPFNLKPAVRAHLPWLGERGFGRT